MPKYKIVKIMSLHGQEMDVNFEVNTEKNGVRMFKYINQTFSEEFQNNFDNISSLFCIDENRLKLTILKCTYDYSFGFIDLIYNGIFVGNHINNLNDIEINAFILYSINTGNNYLPVLNGITYELSDDCTLQSEQYQIEKLCGTKFTLKSKTPTTYECMRKCAEMLYEIYYLHIGYFDKVNKVELIGNHGITYSFYSINALNSLYLNVYYNTVLKIRLTSLIFLDYKKSLPIFENIIKIGKMNQHSNIFFKYILTSQYKNMPMEVSIAIMVQCINGFMNGKYRYLFKNKNDFHYYNYQKQEVKCRRCLEKFIALYDSGKRIFIIEKNNKTYEEIISDLINIRNLFSHVSSKQFTLNTKKYYHKLSLLWRVVLLEELKITIDENRLNKNIQNIENNC